MPGLNSQCLRRAPIRRRLAAGVKSRYASPFAEDRFGGLLMHGQALGLAILLVPSKIQPAQPVEDGIERSLRIALDVGIVDAQDHRAAVVAGVEPVEDERARAADMEKAGGRRREANS
jgi:hypothetical protein